MGEIHEEKKLKSQGRGRGGRGDGIVADHGLMSQRLTVLL